MLAVAHVLGMMMALFAVTFLMPLISALVYQDGTFDDFAVAAGINVVVGLALAGLDSQRMTAEEAQELIDDVLARRQALADEMGLTDVHAAFTQAREEDDAQVFPPRENAEAVAKALSRLRRALLILQLSPNDPILSKRQ